MIFKALVAAYRRLFYGRDVSEKVYEKRLNICKECPHKRKSIRGAKCNLCGCTIVIKAKWDTEECPENKWKDE